MKLYYEKGLKTEKDIEEIHLLDSITYSEKYLLTLDDYKERVNKNKDIFYVVRNSRNTIVGYFSLVPISLDAYEEIKAGAIDKQVITKENILTPEEEYENIYWDSIIVDPKYRKYKIGKKLVAFGLNDIVKNHKSIKRIVAHAISKGGEKLTSKYGLIIKKKLEGTSFVMEKVYTNKKSRKKVKYRGKNKKAMEKKVSRATVGNTYL